MSKMDALNLISMVLVIACGSVAHATNSDLEAAIKSKFESLLSLNDIVLSYSEREARLPLFSVNCLVQQATDANPDSDPCPDINADAMYSDWEIAGMNGAEKEKSLPLEMEIDEAPVARRRREASVPTSYDVRDHIQVSKPAYQGVCGNCYVHAFVSALEIAYTKQTGKVPYFSRQELTDCFYKGCRGGDFRVLTDMVASTDHLATAADYGPYLAQHTNNQFTCKAALTPDSLLDIKVKGYKSVPADQLDYYLHKFGSVMTCMKWKESDSDNCGRVVKIRKGEIFDGDEVKDGCDHAVLVVGYTPEYYIVKNSHGVTWGDGGYFRVKRGGNVCGIEDSFVVLITEPRSSSKHLAANRCPSSHPTYCSNSHSCTSAPSCVDTFQRARRSVVSSGEVVSTGEVLTVRRRKRSGCVDKVGEAKCAIVKQRGMCDSGLSAMYCQKSCGKCETGGASSCTDSSPRCASIPDGLCVTNAQVKAACRKKCGDCGGNNSVVQVMTEYDNNGVSQARGPCPIPSVAHGKVVVPGEREFLNYGEVLDVQCDPGYVRIGEEVKCVVQDVFSPDSRLISQCVEDTLSEVLSGNGATYDGTRAVSVSGKPCLNWRKESNAGSVFSWGTDALTFTNENHNFCRNSEGLKPVPYCLIDNSAKAAQFLGIGEKLSYAYIEPEFCFKSPGCDTCAGNLVDIRDDICPDIVKKGLCQYRDYNSLKATEYYWKYCRKSCCETTQCLLQ